MNKVSFFLSILLAIISVMAHGQQGTKERIKVYSFALEGNLVNDPAERDVTVYLPPSYPDEPNRYYPVVYMLHGFTDNDSQWFGWEEHWINLHQVIDAALEDGQTKEMIIHDSVDGQEAKMSLAMAIDMLEPCNWDFVGSIVTLLKAIGGELRPERPYACHQRNLKLSPLCDRLVTISNTLRVFWKEEETNTKTDQDILNYLGDVTPIKRWLSASCFLLSSSVSKPIRILKSRTVLRGERIGVTVTSLS